MDFLQKTWVRVVISLLAAGIIIELFTMRSVDPNHTASPDRNSLYNIVLGAIIFFVLTGVVKRNNKNTLK
jgi:uncharacterized membrane protein YidH (DUF202 family)